MPEITGVLETCLYVAEMDRALRFYQDVIGLKRMVGDERFAALDACGRQVLLLFLEGGTTKPVTLPHGGVIPPHDGRGTTHVGFAVAKADLRAWEERLAAHGVAIESRVTWPRGGVSLYFRDPDQHLVELLTPGVWPTY